MGGPSVAECVKSNAVGGVLYTRVDFTFGFLCLPLRLHSLRLSPLALGEPRPMRNACLAQGPPEKAREREKVALLISSSDLA